RELGQRNQRVHLAVAAERLGELRDKYSTTSIARRRKQIREQQNFHATRFVTVSPSCWRALATGPHTPSTKVRCQTPRMTIVTMRRLRFSCPLRCLSRAERTYPSWK